MWEAFKDFIFWVIEALHSVFGDWGLAILIITLIFRAAITPLMYKQSKSSYQMRKIQPLINQIKERFADDPVRQNQETQKLYAEAKFNPLAGCVPMLIQMPIFIALFQVLREMADRVGDTSSYMFYNIVPDLTQSPSGAWEIGGSVFIPYVILLAIFALCTFIPTLLTMNQQDPSQKNQTLIMVVIMSIMMIWIGWSSPAGVLLFWGASSLLAIAQQQISLHIVKKKDAEAEVPAYVIENSKINVDRKVRKKRSSKKR